MYPGIFGHIDRTVRKAQRERDRKRARARGEIDPHSKVTIYETDYEELRKASQSLKSVHKSLIVESRDYDMQTHHKWNKAAELALEKSVLMFILTEDKYRPEKGVPYSLSLVSKVRKSLKKALYQSAKPIGAEDIGKPLIPNDCNPEYKLFISPDNFIGERKSRDVMTTDEAFYDMSGGDHYFLSDAKNAVERGEQLLGEIEEKGRANGLLTD